MHNTQQSSHTNSTVYRPCKNHSPSTDSADSIFLRSSSVRPARENDRSGGKMYSKCTVKFMGWGIPMHAHRARGVPAGCWTHPRGDPVLLAPSPRVNRELYPHTHGFPVGPAGNPLSPSPCSSLFQTVPVFCYSGFLSETAAISSLSTLTMFPLPPQSFDLLTPLPKRPALSKIPTFWPAKTSRVITVILNVQQSYQQQLYKQNLQASAAKE